MTEHRQLRCLQRCWITSVMIKAHQTLRECSIKKRTPLSQLRAKSTLMRKMTDMMSRMSNSVRLPSHFSQRVKMQTRMLRTPWCSLTCTIIRSVAWRPSTNTLLICSVQTWLSKTRSSSWRTLWLESKYLNCKFRQTLYQHLHRSKPTMTWSLKMRWSRSLAWFQSGPLSK